MDYNDLIRTAWSLTWRFKSLWVLGLLTGMPATSCSGSGIGQNYQWPPDGFDELDRGSAASGADLSRGEVTRWLQDHLELLLVISAIIALVLLLLFVLHLIALGAMARAADDVSRGREITLGRAWGVGVRLIWRYGGLALLNLAATALFVIVGGAALLAFGFQGGRPRRAGHVGGGGSTRSRGDVRLLLDRGR